MHGENCGYVSSAQEVLLPADRNKFRFAVISVSVSAAHFPIDIFNRLRYLHKLRESRSKSTGGKPLLWVRWAFSAGFALRMSLKFLDV